jgi:hypothetical protein
MADWSCHASRFDKLHYQADDGCKQPAPGNAYQYKKQTMHIVKAVFQTPDFAP